MKWLFFTAAAVLAYLVSEKLFTLLLKNKIGMRKRLESIYEIDSEDNRPKKSNARETRLQKLNFLRISSKMRETIILSGIDARPEEVVLYWFMGVFILTILTFTFTTDYVQTIAVMVVAISAPPIYIRVKVNQNRFLFQVQLGDALMILSNALRAGFSFQQAVASASKVLPYPIGKEFGIVSKEIQIGMDIEESLHGVSERMNSEDIKLLATAVVVQQKVGGNLAEIMDTLSKTIRERLSVARNIKTLTAQGRMSGIVVGGIPIFSLLSLSVINPSYIAPLFETSFGKLLLFVGVIMQLTAFLFIRKMIDIRL